MIFSFFFIILGFTAIGVTAAFSPAAIPAAFACIKSSAILTFLTKATLSIPLTYHYFNGVRHLVCVHFLKFIKSVLIYNDLVVGFWRRWN